jgi:hypothetical protein
VGGLVDDTFAFCRRKNDEFWALIQKKFNTVTLQMNITLKNGNNYPVYKPKLILEVNSCPKIELYFGHGDYPSVEKQIELSSSNADVTLSWDGGKLKIQVVGFEYGTAPTKIPNKNTPYLVMTGLILQANLQTWFNQSHQSNLIYQQNSERGDVFFANKLLNGKIQLRDKEREILKKLCPPNSMATFLRQPQQDNFSFLCHLIDFISSQESTIIGWTAFQSQNEPLRLVSLCNEPLELDDNWKPRGQFPTNRYAGQTWASGNFELVRNFPLDNPLDLLPDLITIGKQDTDLINIDIQDKEQLALIPGPMCFKGKKYFCRTITYQFPEQPDDYDLSAILTLTETYQPPIASPLLWQMVDCQFQGWEEETGKLIKLQLENAAVANSEGEPDSEKLLYAQVLSPIPPRKNYQGFYVKYQEGDNMRCLLIPGQVPTVLGSIQNYNEEFENQADLILHAEHIALSGNQVTIEAEKQVSIKGNEVVKIGNKVEVGSD